MIKELYKKNKKLFISGFIGLLIILIIVGNIFRDDSEVINVETEKISRQKIIQKVNASGKIQPESEVKISATSSAIIDSITVVEGEYVKKNQHLISLDRKQLQANVDQVTSAVRSASARVKQDKANRERVERIYEQGLASDQELEGAQAAYEISKSQLDQSRASLLVSQDALDKARLVSPQNGIVTKINKEAGEMAMGGMFSLDVLMIIADLSRMEVIVDVNENDVVSISIGDTSEIEIDAFPDTVFYGVVSEIAHTAQSLNMGSQQQVTNFKVKVKMIDPPNKIRPGMSSTVNIISETIKDTISIPIQSLTSRSENYSEIGNAKKDGKKYRRENKGDKEDDKENNSFVSKKNTIDVVFVLEDEFDGEAAPEGEKYALVRPVTVGISSENHYAVKSGVSENEMIVTGGYRVLSKELNHGTLVSVKNDPKNDNGRSDKNHKDIKDGVED